MKRFWFFLDVDGRLFHGVFRISCDAGQSKDTENGLRDNLLIGFYLSFFDKKDLTNGIDWFIPCAMNTNEISPKAGSRLNRIKIISRIFRVLIGILVVLMMLMSALFFLASVKLLVSGPPMVDTLHISFSPHQAYTSPFNVPLPVLLIGAVQLGLGGCGLILLNRLFKLYERGDFFKTENIRCIKFLGLIVIGIWLTQTILELMAHQNNLEASGLVYGVLIVFIAWIMDEGRKIQEEQELTV